MESTKTHRQGLGHNCVKIPENTGRKEGRGENWQVSKGEKASGTIQCLFHGQPQFAYS